MSILPKLLRALGLTLKLWVVRGSAPFAAGGNSVVLGLRDSDPNLDSSAGSLARNSPHAYPRYVSTIDKVGELDAHLCPQWRLTKHSEYPQWPDTCRVREPAVNPLVVRQ